MIARVITERRDAAGAEDRVAKAVAIDLVHAEAPGTKLADQLRFALQDLGAGARRRLLGHVREQRLIGGVQLIPASMIGVLAAAGSTNPTAIIAPTILATAAGTIAAIVAARLLQPFYPQRRETTAGGGRS